MGEIMEVLHKDVTDGGKEMEVITLPKLASLDDNIAVYEANLPRLEADYWGKWVVFYDEQMVGAFDGFQEAASEAVKSYGRGPYLIRQVGAPPPHISSFRLPVGSIAQR